MENKEIVIVSAVRTPFGRYCGSLREMDYFDLGAIPMKEVLKKISLDPKEVQEVFWGVGDTSPCKDVYAPVAARQTIDARRMAPPSIVSALGNSAKTSQTQTGPSTTSLSERSASSAAGTCRDPRV